MNANQRPRRPLPGSVKSVRLSRHAAVRRRHAVAMVTLTALVGAGLAGVTHTTARAQNANLPHPRSLKALLAQSGRDRRPIVAMFSIHGCPWCAAIRREQLNGLLREESERGVRVVEFDLYDDAAFEDAGRSTTGNRAPVAGAPSSPGAAGARSAPVSLREAGSPAALARLLGVKIAPTLVFLGPDGEIAERLVGYGSPDFFSAYLDDRIDKARRTLGAVRRTGTS